MHPNSNSTSPIFKIYATNERYLEWKKVSFYHIIMIHGLNSNAKLLENNTFLNKFIRTKKSFFFLIFFISL